MALDMIGLLPEHTLDHTSESESLIECMFDIDFISRTDSTDTLLPNSDCTTQIYFAPVVTSMLTGPPLTSLTGMLSCTKPHTRGDWRICDCDVYETLNEKTAEIPIVDTVINTFELAMEYSDLLMWQSQHPGMLVIIITCLKNLAFVS